MTWPQMEQRMRFRSSAVPWSQPKRMPSGRLRLRPKPSSRLVFHFPNDVAELPLCFAPVTPEVMALFWKSSFLNA